MWKQKARTQWLQEGDRNTKISRLSTLKHRVANKIRTIKREDRSNKPGRNQRCTSQLLQETSLQRLPTELLELIPARITEEMNFGLMTAFSEEVHRTLRAFPRNKTPRPDGFTIEFYLTCWDIIGLDVTAALNKFHKSGSLLKAWNATFPALIPKT